ncbi:MAG: DUF998 domain-containing protein, partial [Acidimicrobiia bacterium]
EASGPADCRFMQSVVPRESVIRALGRPAASWKPAAVPWRRHLLAASLAGPAALAVAIAVSAVLHPGYSHRQPVSLLGADGAPYGWLFAAGMVASGAGLTVLSWIMLDVVSPMGRLAARISLMSGMLLVVAAGVPCSQGCPAPWTAEATGRDLTHFMLVVAAAAGLVAAPVAARRWMCRSGCAPRFRRLTGLLLAPIVAGAVLTFAAEALPLGVFAATTGIWQRIMIAGSLTWYSTIAILVLRRRR